MPIQTVRFGQRGRGEQLSNGPKTQSGLLSAQNVTSTDGAFSKRPGSIIRSLSRSDDPTDLVPGPLAISSRNNDVVIVTDSELYSHQTCGLGDASTSGTATPTEIADAQAAVQDRRDTSRTLDIPLAGSVTAGAARTRLDRPDLDPDVIITPSGRTITFTLNDATRWTASEPGESDATNTLLGPNQRLVRMRAIDVPPQSKPIPSNPTLMAPVEEVAIVVTWISGATPQLNHDTVYIFKVAIPGLITTTDRLLLNTLRGNIELCRYEVRSVPLGSPNKGAIVAFPLTGSNLRVYEFDTPGTSQGYTVTDPPDGTVSPNPFAYDVDLSINSYPADADGLAVSWASASDGIQHAAQLRPTSSTIVSEQQHVGVRQDSSIRISIVDAAIVTWDLADQTTGDGTPRPVYRFDPADTAIRFIDLDGDDLRTKFSRVTSGGDVGRQQYRFANATSDANITPILLVTGIAGETDAQWQVLNNTIHGILTSPVNATPALGGLLEVGWERTAEVVAVSWDTSITSAAQFVQDNALPTPETDDRILWSYWTSDTNLEIIKRNFVGGAFTTQSIVVPLAVGVFANAMGMTLLFTVGAASSFTMIWTWTDDGDVVTVATTPSAAPADITFERIDTFPEVPLYVAGIATQPTLVRGILAVSYSSESIEVYEVTNELFVRVSPALGVRAGGNWSSRGTWTRTRLLSDVVRHHGNEDVISADAATVVNDEGELCTFVGSEVTGNGALFDIISTHNEAQGVIDATGKRPRVSPHTATTLFVGVEDSLGQLSYAVWSPGSALSFTPSGVTLRLERAWDQTGFEVNAEPAGVWAVIDSSSFSDIEIYVWPRDSAPFSFTRPVNTAVTTDVSIAARVLSDGVTVELTWAACGISIVREVWTGIESINMTTQVVTQVFINNHQFGVTVLTPRACSAYSLDGITSQVWTEYDGPVNRSIEVDDVTSATDVIVTTYKRAALVSQLANVSGSIVGAISLLGTSASDPDVVDTTFVGGQAYRDGIVLLSATTREVVGRVSVGLVEDFATRLLRPPKTGINLGPDSRIDLGWQEADLDIGTTRAPTLVRYAWTPDSSAHEPAVLDAIMVGAHGGYPRMYDGRVVNEHDWHELPEIVQITTPASGTSLTAGNYNLAVTLEGYDSRGQLYRSRPTFAGPITLLAGDSILVITRDLTITERDNVRAVLWRTTEQTVANADPSYYRETEALATLPVGVDATPTSLSLADALLIDRERLDQGDLIGDVLPSDPIEITDFTAQLDSRIWGVVPRQPNSMYYTVAAAAPEGPPRGAHWSLAQIITHDGEGPITAAVQMGSRIGLLTALGGSGTYTPGPNSIGAGSYSSPERLNMSIGPASHSAIAKIPEGIVFAPARLAPIQLLSSGWTAVDLGDEIADPYERGVQIAVALAYVQSTNAIHVLGATTDGTHQLQLDAKTWETDTRRTGLDLTVRDNGQLVILSPTLGALFEVETVFNSGGVGYITSSRTPWFLTDGRPEMQGNLVEVRVLGQYRGAHSLTIREYNDYKEAVVAELVVSSATLAQHFADGEPYIYYYRLDRKCTAVSIEVLDDGQPNESFAIEQVIVSTESATTGGTPVLRGLTKGHALVTPV